MRYLTPQQNRLMRWRARILAGILAVVCFGGLLVRLFLLQVVDRDGYAARAADQQLRGATLPAPGGKSMPRTAHCWRPARPAGPSGLRPGNWTTHWWSRRPGR